MQKFYILVLSILIFSVSTLQAQTEVENINYPMSIGPYMTFKGGVNAAEVPEGLKNGVAFNGFPDLGAIWYQPFRKDSKFGLLIETAYSSYAFILKPYSQPNRDEYILKLSYLTLGAELYIYGFTVGLNTGTFINSDSDLFKIDEGDINTMLEFRIGGMIPLVSTTTGRLNLMIRAGYHLFGVYESNKLIGFSGYNLHPASAELGFSYLFHLYKKGERPKN